MKPRFFYFDLGNVLVNFNIERMLRQMSDVSGAAVEKVREVVYDGGLQRRYETGEIRGREFYESFCDGTGTRPDYDALELAGSDIFELNVSILSLVARFRAAGHRMGILSNTCESHWEHCKRRYRIVNGLFDVAALSYQIGAMKPDAAIFQAAAKLAGHAPEEIFFVDDTPGHVEGAKNAGYDAVKYLSTSQLADDLRRRGMRFNY